MDELHTGVFLVQEMLLLKVYESIFVGQGQYLILKQSSLKVTFLTNFEEKRQLTKSMSVSALDISPFSVYLPSDV